MENTMRWVNLDQLPDIYPATFSIPLLNRIGGENKVVKLKTGRSLISYCHGQNSVNYCQLKQIWIVRNKSKKTKPAPSPCLFRGSVLLPCLPSLPVLSYMFSEALPTLLMCSAVARSGSTPHLFLVFIVPSSEINSY